MKPEFENIEVKKNSTNNRFEITVDGYTAFIDYRENDNSIALIHTESPEELSGRGVATALIEKTLIYLEDNHYELIPLCPLVVAYIQKNIEWVRIVKLNFKSKFTL